MKTNRFLALGMMLFNGLVLFAQIDLPQDYSYALSYTETKNTSYKIEDPNQLTDLDKLTVMGDTEIKDITNYEVGSNETHIHIDYSKRKEGWYSNIDEMLITPTHIHSRIGKSYRSKEIGDRQITTPSQLTLTDRIKMPELTLFHINELKQNNVPYYTTLDGVTVIKTSGGSSIEIDPIRKNTKEIKLINNDGVLASIERTNYYIPIHSTTLVKGNGMPVFPEDDPLWMPIKIVVEEPVTLPSGLCAIKIIVTDRENIVLDGNNSMQLRTNGGKQGISNWNPSISPNPASEIINISDLDNLDNYTIEVYDAHYRKLELTAVNNEVNVAQLPTGMYFAIIKSDDQVRTLKFIKS